MRRVATVVVLAVCCFPAAALGRRLAHGREKAAIIAAIRRAHEVGPSQVSSCMRVYVSTVDRNWATMQFIHSSRCERHDANGVSVIRRRHGQWRFVTSGSSFSCPAPGHIPGRVQRDLRLTCIRGMPVVIVGNYRDGTVTVIDQRTFRVLGTLNVIPDGKTPQDPAQAAVYPALVASKGVDYVQGLALSPDGRTLYVSRGYLGDVAAFDIARRRMLWRLQVSGVRADHVALSPDGSRLFVSALTTNEVQVIDTRTHQFVGSFPTGDWAHVLEFTPDGRFIVNGSLGNQLLPNGAPNRFWMTFADPRTLQVAHVLRFDAGVRPFTFSLDGRLAYVQFSYFNGFKVVNTSTGATVHTVNLPVRGPAIGESPSQYPNQAAHHGITLSGDGRTICDAATVSNYAALVSTQTLQTEAVIPVGDQPAEAQTSSDGRLCFVSNRGPGPGDNKVSVISFDRRREIAQIPAGDGPMEMVAGTIPPHVLHEGTR